MKNGHNYAVQGDPRHNPNFGRQWDDDPLALSDFKHFGREVAPKIVVNFGRRAISRWLEKASGAHGAPATKAFQEADKIRLKMGLGWEELVNQRSVA